MDFSNVDSHLFKNLKNLGNKLSDYEEVPDQKKNKNYTILGKGNFAYVEKMKSKKNNSYYAIKKVTSNNFDPINFSR